MRKIISVVLAALLFITLFTAVFAGQDSSLSFSGDGSFRIMVFSDTQDDQYPAYDMLNFVKKSIEQSDPDLIVFTGDLVEDSRIGDIGIDDESFREGVVVENKNGDIDHDKTRENIEKAVKPIFDILEKSGVPYALVQGNNDHKCGITNDEWLEIYSEYPGCLVKDMSPDAEGRIDYNLEIKGSNGKTVFNLWMLDSGKGGVNDDQIEWYRSASSALTEKNGGEPVPAFFFQHINTADIGNVFEKCNIWDDGAGFSGGSLYRLNREIATGNNFFTYQPGTTTDEFKAWKEQGDVIGAFFGHQHVDGFSGTVDGTEFGFIYGCEFAKIGPYGYRVFTLKEDDILNYTNEVYVYEGSVRYGTDRIEKQIDEVYDDYNNPFEKAVGYGLNVFRSIISMIISLF